MSFHSELILEELPAASMWRLREPLVYLTAGGETITVPSGFRTDLASIPAIFTPLLPINDFQRPAAVVHDWLYAVKRIGVPIPRVRADRVLREAMVSLGEPLWRVRLIYWGVRIGGGGPWHRDRAPSLVELQTDPQVVLSHISGALTGG